MKIHQRFEEIAAQNGEFRPSFREMQLGLATAQKWRYENICALWDCRLEVEEVVALFLVVVLVAPTGSGYHLLRGHQMHQEQHR